MKRRPTPLAVLCATLACAPAMAQNFVIEPGDWTLRRSATGAAAKLPAAIAYTKPANGDASYAVDAATGFGFGYLRPADTWQVQGAVGAVAEIHRNTAIDKAQHKTLAGLSSSAIVNVDSQRLYSLLLDGALRTERDHRSETRGTSLMLNLRPVVKPLYIGQPIWLVDKKAALIWDPSIGLEHLRERNKEGARGRLARWSTGLAATAFYEVDEARGARWKLDLRADAWRELSESGSLRDGRKRQYFREAGLGYQLNRNVAITLKRVSGENPVEGLSQQRYKQLTVEVFH